MGGRGGGGCGGWPNPNYFQLIFLLFEKTCVCKKIIIDAIIWYIITGDQKMAHKIGILPAKSVRLAFLCSYESSHHLHSDE